MATFDKSSAGVLDYQITWSSWLDSETISSSSWSAESGITIDSDSNTDTAAVVWLSGGTDGIIYDITNTIVTSASRTASRTIKINVAPKFS